MNRKVIIIALIPILLLLGGWYLVSGPKAVVMAAYVPASALGYIEVNDWPRFVSEMSETEAWKSIAPAYGLDGKISDLGRVGWLRGLSFDNEAAVLARSQFAVALTGIEVRGDEVKPLLALIVETHSDSETITELSEKRLRNFARSTFGEAVGERTEYAGVVINSYRPGRPGAERRLHSAIIESELIVSNNAESLRACIDARLDRVPDMAGNFYQQNGRPVVDRGSAIFGFVTGEGVNRLIRFGAFIVSNSALRETGLTDVLQDVLSDLAEKASTGIVWGAGFEDGRMVDRYLLLMKPEIIESIRPRIKVSRAASVALEMLPSGIDDLTVIRIEKPNQAIDEVERAISARIGVGQSFLLHQFLLGARQSLLGIEPVDRAYSALGDEVASFRFDDQTEDRVWILALRDVSAAPAIARGYLGSSAVTDERIGDNRIFNAKEKPESAVGLKDRLMVLGKRPQVLRLLSGKGDRLKDDSRFTAAGKFAEPVAVFGCDSIARETAEMFAALSRLAGANDTSRPELFDRLPFAVSSTDLHEQGILIETRSSFGNLPFYLSLMDGAADEQ